MDKELISFAELSQRLNKSKAYISQLKSQGKLDHAIVEVTVNGKIVKKVEYKKALLGLSSVVKDPNPHHVIAKKKQEKKIPTPIKKAKAVIPEKKIVNVQKKVQKKVQQEVEQEVEQVKSKPENLLKQIEDKINDVDTPYVELQSLKAKAEILKIYFSAQSEELKHKQSLGSLFAKEEIEGIFISIVSNVRNSLLGLANNYAIKLEGLHKKEIKTYVEDDINRILLDLKGSFELDKL